MPVFFLCYLYWSVGQRTMFPWTKMPLLLPWSHLHPPNDSSLETLKIQHGKKCFSDMLRPADIFDTLPADVQNLVSDACAQSKSIQIILNVQNTESNGRRSIKALFKVDLGLGLTVIGLEQLGLYFQLLLTLLPSYLRSPWTSFASSCWFWVSAVLPLCSPAPSVPPGSTLQFVPGLCQVLLFL